MITYLAMSISDFTAVREPWQILLAYILSNLGMLLLLTLTVMLHIKGHPLATLGWGIVVCGAASILLRTPFIID